MIGSRIGQYRISREIASGGMGVIYEAIHDEIGRQAAIKVLSPHCAADPRYVRRFLIEARAISRVRHPGLVQIYDFGETPAGTPYILMEFLDALRVRMMQGPLPIPEIRRIVRQIAAGLAAVHDQRIVHRDLKPENAMIVRDDEASGGERIKLLDFGIARFFASVDATVTAPGSAIGTAVYMSPEQCAGDADISGAADVYALGVIIHELLAGTPPFSGPSSSAVMRKHLVEEPPPLPPSAPTDLAVLAERMLAKEPALRPTMREIVDALPEAADNRVSSAAIARVDDHPAATQPLPREERARSSRRWWIASAVVTAGAVAWPAYSVLREPVAPSRPPAVTGMAWFSGGTFRMGRTADELDRECERLGALCSRKQLDYEQPVRAVTLSPYYLDQLEATNEQVAGWLTTLSPSLELRVDGDRKVERWVFLDGVRLVDLAPPYAGIERVAGRGFRARDGHERRPAVQLTWDGASMYCQSRGKRLPTEAEWEFAARGTTARRFPWGEQDPTCDGVAWGRDVKKPCEDRGDGPDDVGTRPLDRTPEGVRDLGGNVREWVFDQFRLLYPSCGECQNPHVEEPIAFIEDMRVVRGGSWPGPLGSSRSTARGRWKRTEVSLNTGVRCAR